MQFLWLYIYTGKYREFLELLKSPQKKTLVFTPNPEILLRASKDQKFLEILRQADYLTPDANGLYVWAQMQEGKSFLLAWFKAFFSKKLLEKKYGELISGSNLTKDLIDHAQRIGKKILMIDNYRIGEPENPFEIRKKEIQAMLPELFATRFPELQVQIIFDTENSVEEIAQIIQKENISYVFSCIGMKTQEQRLLEIFAHIPEDFPVVWLGVGSSFDYLLGLQKRAPIIVQRLGLEWLYRLILEPRKRWRRIWDAVVEFPRMVKIFG